MRLPAKQAKALRFCIVKCIDGPTAIAPTEDALELTKEWALDDLEKVIWEDMVYRKDHLIAQLEESPVSVEQPRQYGRCAFYDADPMVQGRCGMHY